MNEITVRRMRENELERVNELRATIQQQHCNGRPDIFQPPSNAFAELGADLARRENICVLVAVRDDNILGYAITQDFDRKPSPYMLARRFVHVEEFCVDERCRRMGAGRALMAFIRNDAQSRGFSRVELDVWAFNEDARHFYDAEGFHTYRYFLELNMEDAQC